MPSTDIFDAQSEEYKQSVLPKEVTARIAIEAGIDDYWYKYVGLNGKIIGLHRYGESAPYKEVYKALGITVENIVQAAADILD
jgi:transketolase